MREKVGKSRFTVFFQFFVAPEGRKVGSLKRRVRSQLASGPEERWKIARRCGAKHISKSKCTKHTTFGPLLEVEMLKKCTPLWREAHFQVKMLKTLGVWTTFGTCDVEKVHAVVARMGQKNEWLPHRAIFHFCRNVGQLLPSLEYQRLPAKWLHPILREKFCWEIYDKKREGSEGSYYHWRECLMGQLWFGYLQWLVIQWYPIIQCFIVISGFWWHRMVVKSLSGRTTHVQPWSGTMIPPIEAATQDRWVL